MSSLSSLTSDIARIVTRPEPDLLSASAGLTLRARSDQASASSVQNIGGVLADDNKTGSLVPRKIATSGSHGDVPVDDRHREAGRWHVARARLLHQRVCKSWSRGHQASTDGFVFHALRQRDLEAFTSAVRLKPPFDICRRRNIKQLTVCAPDSPNSDASPRSSTPSTTRSARPSA